MNRFLVTGVIASAAFSAAIALAPNPVYAAPVVYDFTGSLSNNNIDLGQTEVYTAIGGPNLTAAAGTYGGSAPAGNNDSFTSLSSNHLVGNNRGAGEQGLGVCSGNCNTNGNGTASGENGEIDRETACCCIHVAAGIAFIFLAHTVSYFE